MCLSFCITRTRLCTLNSPTQVCFNFFPFFYCSSVEPRSEFTESTSLSRPGLERLRNKTALYTEFLMGAAFVQPQFPNVVGGFGYNTCFDLTVCNAICCCGLPRWYVSCCGCVCDARVFTDAAWSPGTVLRSEFEKRLRSQELRDILRSSPNALQQCCCFAGLASSAGEVDRLWCPKVNQELLHPAGYSCKAHSWITYNEKGQKQEHMQMMIQRNG